MVLPGRAGSRQAPYHCPGPSRSRRTRAGALADHDRACVDEARHGGRGALGNVIRIHLRAEVVRTPPCRRDLDCEHAPASGPAGLLQVDRVMNSFQRTSPWAQHRDRSTSILAPGTASLPISTRSMPAVRLRERLTYRVDPASIVTSARKIVTFTTSGGAAPAAASTRRRPLKTEPPARRCHRRRRAVRPRRAGRSPTRTGGTRPQAPVQGPSGSGSPSTRYSSRVTRLPRAARRSSIEG